MNNEDQPLLNKRAAKLADAIAAFGAIGYFEPLVSGFVGGRRRHI